MKPKAGQSKLLTTVGLENERGEGKGRIEAYGKLGEGVFAGIS
jgi:hypothetical protein